MTQDLTAMAANLRHAGEYEPLGHHGWEAADAIEAQAAEIARLNKQWEDHDAAWSERVAALTDNLRHIIAERDETFALMLARAEKAEAEIARLREGMVGLAMTLNKTAEYQVAELMAEIARLREAVEYADRILESLGHGENTVGRLWMKKALK